jgi:microcystin-dependent protein
VQTSAPSGWVKFTGHDNKALRVVSGTTGSGGGSVPFTTAFANQNVGDTTLTASQIPGHTHTFSGSGTTGNAGGHSHTIDDPSHAHSLTAWHLAAAIGSGGGGDPAQRLSSYGAVGTAGATTGISINGVGDHAHSVSISGTTGSLGGGTAHSHTINLDVQYVDVIICTKS